MYSWITYMGTVHRNFEPLLQVPRTGALTLILQNRILHVCYEKIQRRNVMRCTIMEIFEI